MWANATRYDIRSASPDPAVMQAAWTAWATICALTAVASGTVCVGVLTSRKARCSPFHLHLVSLLFCNMCGGQLYIVTNPLNLSRGYVSPFLCEFQAVYLMFSVAASN